MNKFERKVYSAEENNLQVLQRLPEECVEYTLYIAGSLLKSEEETRKHLETILHESDEMMRNLLQDYIWHCESFNLKIQKHNEKICLHGLTVYGDSVGDEWLIVYILRELSKRFPELWIKVTDSDGEFLLIEAANTLPRWLTPEIADNRVWIHNNKLYLIPFFDATSPPEPSPSAHVVRPLGEAESLKIIDSTPEIIINLPNVQEEAFYRLRDYPSEISASLHNATVHIPRKLAYILKNLPATISPAVEALYLRDPISLKFLQADRSKLLFPPDDLVKISVRFTKLLFMKAKYQEIPIHPAWWSKLSDAKKSKVELYESLRFGMKLTSAFEILMKDPQYKKNCSVQQINLLMNDIITNGNCVLPSDADLSCWNYQFKEDDDSWMKIDYCDFERELAGKSDINDWNHEFGNKESGFGDTKTQADLRKMVERFKEFLNDEDAGLEGAEYEEVNTNDEQSSSEDDEDKEIHFDSDEFCNILKSILEMKSDSNGPVELKKSIDSNENYEKENTEDTSEINHVKEMMEEIETELKQTGVLNLDFEPSEISTHGSVKRRKDKSEGYNDDGNDESDERLDIDLNLAKNLIESLKSQDSVAGPASNLLGMMGLNSMR